MERKGNVSWEMDGRMKKKRKAKLAKLTILFAHLLIVQPIKLALKHTKDILCCVVFYDVIGYTIIITVCNKKVHFAHPSAKFSLFLFPLRFSPSVFPRTIYNRYVCVSGEIFMFLKLIIECIWRQ